MGFDFYINFILLTFTILINSERIQSQEIKSARLLDLVIRDYAFKSYRKNFKTGKIHRVHLPSNLSGIDVDTVRLRCGSLGRYGAKIDEFQLHSGIYVYPCVERVMLVRQNLGSNWSSLYYSNYELQGYQLISPVLGLLAYTLSATNFTSELKIQAAAKPITVDFSNATLTENNISDDGIIRLCAYFDQEGKITLSNQARPNVCAATKQGHFALVVESPMIPLRKRVSKWRIAIGSTIGAALGLFLLTLLMIAVFVNAKKKARMDELERRAYEEEALQVSMVGHVRAVTAPGTRTAPTIEHYENRSMRSQSQSRVS